MTKTIITANNKKPGLGLADIYRYRSLMFTFVMRDFKIQYAQTILGVLWTVMQPITGVIIFTLFFGILIKIDTGNIPYPAFVMAGIMAWYYFTYLVSTVGTSLITAQHLIKKIYFPRLILPFAKAIMGLIDFCIWFVLLMLILLFYKHLPTINIVFFPFFLLLLMFAGLSIGIWLSALTIRFRDFQHFIPYIVNFGIWFTPVFYPVTIIPAQYHHFIYLNPLAGIIAGFRWTLLGDISPSPYYFVSFIPVVLLFVSGLYYFKSVERKIADII